MTEKKYVNREISWLDFNARVLQEAQDDSVPLIERMHFLGIYSNNLEEFYQVRYATIVRAIQFESQGYQNIIKNQSDEDLLLEVNQMVAKQQLEYEYCYNRILEKLEEEGIYVLNETNLLPEHIEYIQNFYIEKLSYSISIYILNEELPAPQIRSGSLYLGVTMKNKEKNKYALVEVPTHTFPRFVQLPAVHNRSYLIYLDDVLRYHLASIFKNFEYESILAHTIKVSRDAELDMDNDVQSSFLETVAKGVEGRKKGQPVRMAYDKELPKHTLDFLLSYLSFDEYDSVSPGSKYHNKRDFMKFPDFGRKDLRYQKIKPLQAKYLMDAHCMFDAIEKKDTLIYTPYHDYSIVLRVLHKAAIDPFVEKIRITIYRAADDSQIIRSLINASRNGKEVTAVLELRARFDESNNVKWSKVLQDEGIKVIFGVPGLKVHSKVAQIVRKAEGGKATQYSILSTGNFNEATANVYTDFTLITAQEDINREINQLFQFFNANYRIQSYKHLMVSPLQTRKKIYKYIKKEIKNKRKGLPAQINIKLNNLSDKEMIDKLYEASQKGVKVRLVVRGINSLVAGVPELSVNIKSVSVVDKFLEHPRMFWFKNGGNDKVFISSADFMTRNLDHRVELSIPILDPELKQTAMTLFDLSFSDNVKARYHNKNNEYANRENDSDFVENRSQFKSYEYLKSLNED